MRLSEDAKGDGEEAVGGEIVAAGQTDRGDIDTRLKRAGDDRFGPVGGQQVAALVLAEEQHMGVGAAGGVQGETQIGGQRHLGGGHDQAAVGQVVNRSHRARPDQAAHEVAVAPLDGQVDRRRGAVLAAEQFAQVQRLDPSSPRVSPIRTRASPAFMEAKSARRA